MPECRAYITNWASSGTYSTIPGGSGFDWENYDFGANGVIFSGPGAGSSSVTIPGRSTPQSMVVKFTGPSFVKKNFYYNFGGCYREEYNVTLNSGCRINDLAEALETTIYPNPATTGTTVSSSVAISKIEISGLSSLYYSSFVVQNLKTVNLNLAGLKPGVYNCRVTTSLGIQNKKIIISRY